MTSKRQASLKESREQRTKLWELAWGDSTSGGVAKDNGEVKSLA